MISLTFGDLKRSDQGHRLLRLNFYLRVKVCRTCFLPVLHCSVAVLGNSVSR